jgi:hypothetical protein
LFTSLYTIIISHGASLVKRFGKNIFLKIFLKFCLTNCVEYDIMECCPARTAAGQPKAKSPRRREAGLLVGEVCPLINQLLKGE